MKTIPQINPIGLADGEDIEEASERVAFEFSITRRSFVQRLGAGLFITVSAGRVLAQPARRRRGGRWFSGRPANVAARIHIGKNGRITVLTGKVEIGQGARAELTQAAAEELRVPAGQVDLIMADTGQTPDDGITAGSRSTPASVPAVRQGAAGAREFLKALAAHRWKIDPAELTARDGKIIDPSGPRVLTYAQLAESEDLPKAFAHAPPADIALTPTADWRLMGTSTPRPNARSLVAGAHQFPSDWSRPGMLYGKVLRPERFGAKLLSIDVSAAKAAPGVIVAQDGDFIGVIAPSGFRAQKAIEALAKTARWQRVPHPSSDELFDYLRRRAREPIPQNPFASELAGAKKSLRQTYRVAYVQHAPMEPRAALAEWNGGHVTIWTGTQNPFGYQREVAAAFHIPAENVRIIVPDFGGGFGGKHSGEAAVEAAKLARAAGRPVLLRWTREEEFTWAYFRPAGVIEAEASLDDRGRITSWRFININSGPSAVDTPYRVGQKSCRFISAEAPLRQGSYRGLAATANNFAREAFMDELAQAAGADPLEFRLAHLENPRLRAVLEKAAAAFQWSKQIRKKEADRGVGLACGTEKGSYVAACVRASIDRARGRIVVEEVCQAFECGALVNPDNMRSQVEGAIVMGLGPALREAMRFDQGRMLNAHFRNYRVPRLSDLPEIEVHLLNRPDLPSAGGGETPLIAVAPAIANALFAATGSRAREMPMPIPPRRPAPTLPA